MNATKIRNAINKLPICNKGKAAVAELVSTITTVEINVKKQGEVWLCNSERIVLVTDDDGIVMIDEAFKFTGSDTTNAPRKEIGFTSNNSSYADPFDEIWVKKLANTPKEYFDNRDVILAKLREEFPLKD